MLKAFLLFLLLVMTLISMNLVIELAYDFFSLIHIASLSSVIATAILRLRTVYACI
jgi:hypothetical protein